MITTSFARLYDNNTEMSAPLGWAMAAPAVTQNNDPAPDARMTEDGPRAGSLSQKFDAETRRHNGATEDGQLGEVILDSLFSMVFPGLAAVFSPLSAMDAVDLYDKTRDAFRRSAQPSLPRRARAAGPATQNHGQPRNRTRQNQPAPMVQRTRRATSGPAMMMG